MEGLLLSSCALTINMVNRVLSAMYFAFAFLMLGLLFSSNAEAIDIDLEPINFTFNPDYPINGEPIEISFEVVNNGNVAANDVTIVVWNSTSECDVEDECIPVFESTEAGCYRSGLCTRSRHT